MNKLKIGLINDSGDIIEVRYATPAELENFHVHADIDWIVVENIPVGQYEDRFEKMNPDWNAFAFNSLPYPSTTGEAMTGMDHFI